MKFRILAALLSAAMLVALTACGGSSGSLSSQASSKEAGKVEDLPVFKEITGTVRYGLRDNVKDQTEVWLESFETMYPNITFQPVVFSEQDLYTQMSAWSSAGKMPDVILGWDNLPQFAEQGWLYPLDKFLQADEESQYIHKASLEGFKLSGKTYAVPAWLQFSSIVVNLDLLDELNLDAPEYDWTVEEFVALAKSATTSAYAGLNSDETLDSSLLMVSQPDGRQEWGYDPKANAFHLTDGYYKKAYDVVQDLINTPQAVAYRMTDDARKSKFGSDDDPYARGKVLLGNFGTWNDLNLNVNLKFKWDYYPIPAQTRAQSKQVVHADYGFMTTAVSEENAPAAFEVLKFFTYGKHGNLVRLSNQRTGWAANNRFTIPPTTQPDVKELFLGSDNVPGGVKYMYEHMDVSAKGDYGKILPGYSDAVNKVIADGKYRISQGEDFSSVMREVDAKLNSGFKQVSADFNKIMADIQKEFGAARK